MQMSTTWHLSLNGFVNDKHDIVNRRHAVSGDLVPVQAIWHDRRISNIEKACVSISMLNGAEGSNG